MTACAVPMQRSFLVNPVDVTVEDPALGFSDARIIADQKAMELAQAPMLLGWYDSKRGRFSPDVACCSEEKPGWIVYAESRGGDLTIDINNEQYVFIYGDFDEA